MYMLPVNALRSLGWSLSKNQMMVTHSEFDELTLPITHCAGKMKGLAFIKDPDGYWIEVLNPNASV